MDNRELGILMGKALRGTTSIASLVVKQNVVAINGDTAEARKFSCSYVADMETLLPIRPWAEGMTTEPGELVYDPDGVNHYMYSGAEKMTHSNPTFYPGASGVYYWSIVPDVLNGAKVFPNINIYLYILLILSLYMVIHIFYTISL